MLKVFLLIIVGLGGDAETAKTFHRWSNTLAESSERLGVTPDRLVYLVGEPVEGDARVSGRSTKEEVTKAFAKFAGAAGADDLVFIALIGHGSWDGRSAKFNMPGPDMGTGEDASVTPLTDEGEQQVVLTGEDREPVLAPMQQVE